jgi:hypothetical protein
VKPLLFRPLEVPTTGELVVGNTEGAKTVALIEVIIRTKGVRVFLLAREFVPVSIKHTENVVER